VSYRASAHCLVQVGLRCNVIACHFLVLPSAIPPSGFLGLGFQEWDGTVVPENFFTPYLCYAMLLNANHAMLVELGYVIPLLRGVGVCHEARQS
jgi:hypothetical protein